MAREQEFNWPVVLSRRITAPASKIWAVISSPGTLALYHPFCENNPVFRWHGGESHDEVRYFNGVVLVRRSTDWHENVGFDLQIGRTGERTSAVSWRIAAIEDQRSSISIAILRRAVQNVPIIVRWLPHFFWLRPRLRRSLQSVVKRLEYFIVHGEKVSRNQFWARPWFSLAVTAGTNT